MTRDKRGQGPPGFDTHVASAARVYDYLLGGKNNFPADREAAAAMIREYPYIRQRRADESGLSLAVPFTTLPPGRASASSST